MKPDCIRARTNRDRARRQTFPSRTPLQEAVQNILPLYLEPGKPDLYGWCSTDFMTLIISMIGVILSASWSMVPAM
jgi:hypothetical protein